MRYRYLLTEDALAVYTAATRRDRERLREAFVQVAQFPDAADRVWSLAGFDFCARRFGRWVVSYRVDSPVREVHIITLDRL